MNPPEKPKPKWTAPCLLDDIARSTRDAIACVLYPQPVPPETCRGCQTYKPWKGNS